MNRISCLSSALKVPVASSSRVLLLGCVRSVSGGYNEDATQQGSVVSGTTTKEKYTPASTLAGRSYRKSIPGIGDAIEHEEDTFPNFKVESGAAQLQLHARRSYERLHTESFAFQEWGEVRHSIVRDFKTNAGLIGTKWDVAEEEMEYTWRVNPGSRDPAYRSPYSPPEELTPRPQPHSDPNVLRISNPVPRRNEMKKLQRGTTFRLDPVPLLQKYASWADYEEDHQKATALVKDKSEKSLVSA